MAAKVLSDAGKDVPRKRAPLIRAATRDLGTTGGSMTDDMNRRHSVGSKDGPLSAKAQARSTGFSRLPSISSSAKLPDSPSGTTRPSSGGQVPEPRLPKVLAVPVIDVAGQALTLSRRHKLEFHEVKWVLVSFLKVKSDFENGGVRLETFRQFLLRAFDVTHVNDELLEGAYAECKAGKGRLEMEKFLNWYKINMFSLVAPLTADAKKWDSDALIKLVAKRHEVREVDVDKIKKTFDRFDTDKSGELDYGEFEGMIRILLGVSSTADLPKERMSRFWKEIDADGSGEVDFEEFTEWYLKYFSTNNPNGGVMESFYASFMPDKQRGQSLDPQAQQEAQAMRESALNRVGTGLSKRATVE
ncbi:unnamed protein product [Polarella glacialis]|uniref:EF-hand domain-containing protein n=1 Tax=Polarella glacialis TaxID=89957 RepID=A0A813JJ18_POLGL|nr:unnamed protein product [Polarella glacialis]